MKLAKNYMIVFIIYLITILGTLYFVFLYNKANIFDYDNKIDMFVLDVSDYEKLKENINNYMYENENFVIYYTKNEVSENLKKIMKDYNLTHEFLYIDTYTGLKKILNDFQETSEIYKEKNYMIYFSNSKIVDVIDCTTFNYEDYKNYFSKVGLI